MINSDTDDNDVNKSNSLSHSKSIETPILLYRRFQYPSGCLGPGSLCVCPNEEDEAMERGYEYLTKGLMKVSPYSIVSYFIHVYSILLYTILYCPALFCSTLSYIQHLVLF